MGLLGSMDDLGLGGINTEGIFDEKEKEIERLKSGAKPVKIVPEEKDLIFDKSFECPVCRTKFTNKFMKTGKASPARTDEDLRVVYEGLDSAKYEVVLCPRCKYSALQRYFDRITPTQIKNIEEKVSREVKILEPITETYTYEHAFDRYRVAMACAVVKNAKMSEKAYICLRTAWLLRGWEENTTLSFEESNELMAQEDQYLANALKGFKQAMSSESFPICGMDEMTFTFLVAALSKRVKDYATAGKMIQTILLSRTAPARIKDKARDMKDDIINIMKKEGLTN